MNAQVNVELKHRESIGDTGGGSAPAVNQSYASAPKVEPPMDRPGGVAAQAVPAAQPRTFPVTIPDGVVPGTQLQVVAPSGQTMMFAVPNGAYPGQQVLVPY
eukprot:CAMPEP_0197289578 /NCGR_PEP_ID=MMETSP0890-20130614/6839_1 /TAXON_ID=44058 ORGANISM="Aureoumbra lagunensis, Strain CCMP1510" /NCGR_SAMPLE_ID=MMETSP0890 /ASSEMBLY_ACC=CAM_ASM_000533 /LENGTH=101 /DNA_ID=CAMNT_0042761065 /DNA_START=543 /DNA_END=848 /DNA_ORIENTATION=-